MVKITTPNTIKEYFTRILLGLRNKFAKEFVLVLIIYRNQICLELRNSCSGKLTLVQVSTMNGGVNLFDVQTNPALLSQGGLNKLLESETIVKVTK